MRGESAPARAARLFRENPWLTVEKARELTGLPLELLNQIYGPIDAERSLEREARRVERKLSREHRPCPLCDSGHGVPRNTLCWLPASAFMDPDGDPLKADPAKGEGFWFDDIGCSCSNNRCPARLMYPRDTIGEAEEAFRNGEFLERSFFPVEVDGKPRLATFADRWVKESMMDLIRRYGADKVGRFPRLNPGFVAEADMLVQLGEARDKGFSTELMCPRCGHMGEHRKAVSPITHRKDWWRVACRHCGARLRHAFPDPYQAARAFEAGEWDRDWIEEKKRGCE